MAIIKGKYPHPPYMSISPSQVAVMFTLVGNRYTMKDLTFEEGWQEMQPHVEFLIGKWSSDAPWDVSVEGALTPQLPTKVLYGHNTRVNNVPFKARVARGEMVVSDYDSISAKLDYRNGGEVLVASNPQYISRYVGEVLRPEGWVKRNDYPPIYNMVLYPTAFTNIGLGSIYAGHLDGYNARAFAKWYQYREMSDGVTPTSVGWNDNIIQDFINENYSPFALADDGDIVGLCTEVVAKANVRTADILTTLVELPKGIASIKMLIEGIIKMFIAAKRRHLRIANKARRVLLEHEKFIHRSNYEHHLAYSLARSKRSRRALNKKHAREVSQARRDLALFIKESTDAVAGLWLQYRYDILPNKLSVESIIKANSEGLTEYARFSGNREVEVELPNVQGFDQSSKAMATLRVFVKRHFKAEYFADASYSFNLNVSLFEAVPYSFMGDWFSNIGDWIASFSSQGHQFDEVATVSLRFHDTNVTYIHAETNASVNVMLSGYTRRVINAQNYCAFQWGIDMNLARQIDAAALSYSIFIKQALTGLINKR